jgi:hypothetical protein
MIYADNYIYEYLRAAYWNGVEWTEMLSTGLSVSLSRGGSLGAAGQVSVDAGSMNLRLLNSTGLIGDIKPGTIVCIYNGSSEFTPNLLAFAGLDTASIFTGKVQDIAVSYELNKTTRALDSFTGIYAVDAVASHSNIQVPGFKGTTYNNVSDAANGYQKWEDRIRDLNTQFAKETIIPPVYSGSVEVYSI